MWRVRGPGNIHFQICRRISGGKEGKNVNLVHLWDDSGGGGLSEMAVGAATVGVAGS